MDYKNLCSPIKVGPLTFKNRMVSAPSQCTMASSEGAVTREIIEFFALKAAGGAAAITVGESSVDKDRGITHGGQLFIDADNKLPGLTLLAEEIKRHGAIASLELCHGGGLTNPVLIGGRDPIGPSPLPDIPGGDRIRQMDEEMMAQVKENFADAAFRLKRAGFDMCLIHAGHGWLLSGFLSPFLNRRKDRYGGSIENRVRFPMEVLECVRKRCGPDFAIELRMAGDELFPEGLQIDEAVEIAKILQDKVDIINVSAGMFNVPVTAARMHPTIYHEQGCNVYLAERIKKAVNIPVSCVGGITTPEMAEQIIAEGKADVVAMARALIADPSFPRKVCEGRRDEIRQCCRCMVCHGRVAIFKPIMCTVNPLIGKEAAFVHIPKKAVDKKKVLIIGGGPGGMQAAITAASRGHKVTLAEKSGRLGGNLFYAEGLPFKQELKPFHSYLISQLESLPVKVRMNTEVTPEYVRREAPDALIVAVGADPIMPDDAGDRVIWAGQTHLEPDSVPGKKVLIVGGGMIGCETALHLAREGKEVTILEMRGELAPDLNVLTRVNLLDLLSKAGVGMLTDSRYEGLDKDGKVRVTDSAGQPVLLDAETVLFSVGFKPRSELADSFNGLAPEIYRIGDCLKPQKITEAVSEGFRAAMEL